MTSTKMMLTFLMLLIPAVIQCRLACLHNGCEMSAGLKMADINATIYKNLKVGAKFENVVSAVSWDVGQVLPVDENNREMCSILNKMDPTFIGLQDVDVIKQRYLKSCLKGYSIIHEDSDNPSQNILLYKESQRIRISDHGSFKASEVSSTGYQSKSSCTWMRVQFARLITLPRPQFSFTIDQPQKKVVNRLHRILSLLLPQKKIPSRIRRDAFTPYRWSNLYVAVLKIHGASEQAAATELHYLVSHLRNKVMDRRRYPLILLVDLGKEDISLAYRSIQQLYHWIKNTMQYSIQTFPAMTRTNENAPSRAMLENYVMKHRFHGLVSGIITDDVIARLSSNRPVFAALL